MSMRNDLRFSSASRLLEDLRHRAISAKELASIYLDAITRDDPSIGAFLRVDRDGVLAEADRIDARRHAGEPMGALAGLPIAIKDVLCDKTGVATAGSKILEHFRPVYDATVISKLRQADALILGKTNLDEFAMGSSTENSAFQITRNPRDLSRAPGGSSGGSAAAIAAGLAALSIGSDTGGSIRQPASFCGCVGLKPTYGRVSRFGLIAYASSLDQLGPLTRDVRDAALLLEVIAGHDHRDATSIDLPVPSYTNALDTTSSMTIGLVKEHFREGLEPEVEKAIRDKLACLTRSGFQTVEVSLPHTKYAIPAYYMIAMAEASSNLARFDGTIFGHCAQHAERLYEMMSRTRAAGFGSEVKRRILLGTYALSKGYKDAFYTKALQVRRLIKDDFDTAFNQADVVSGPTTPTTAFKLGDRIADPVSMYLSDIYTTSANLAGIPAISIPCGRDSSGLPIGIQFMAKAFDESMLLQAAFRCERE